MRAVTASLLVAMLVPAVCPAQEPETRAAEHAKKQEEKASRLAPRIPNRFERRLLEMERSGGFGVTRGWFVSFGDIKSGSAFALGPAYTKLLDNGTMLQAKAAYSVRHFKLVQVSAQSAPVLDKRVTLFARARWQDAPVLAFFPLGPDSPETRADFSERRTEVSGRATWHAARFVRFGGGVSLEGYDIDDSDSKRPSIVELPLDRAVPGLGIDPTYLHTHASAALDVRDGPGYSRRGTLLQATLRDYRQQTGGSGFTFQRVDAQAEQYIPILHGNWVIFLGVRASTTVTDDGNEVPFFLMPKLGGSDLRGYRSWRFRDRHSILFTAEYRWYVQEYVDVAIFGDAGKVVPERSHLDFRGLTSSAGVGIRFHSSQATFVRIEVATGREGARLVFAFSPIGG